MKKSQQVSAALDELARSLNVSVAKIDARVTEKLDGVFKVTAIQQRAIEKLSEQLGEVRARLAALEKGPETKSPAEAGPVCGQ